MPTHQNSRVASFPLLTALATLLLFFFAALLSAPALAGSCCPDLLNHRFNSLQTGKPVDLCDYRGKVVLIVNTASYCGFTDQYGPLEALYRKHKDDGLVVLGFPTNDFYQEPGSNAKIAEFCRLTYGVEFPMFEKTTLSGKDKTRNPLYRQLQQRTGVSPRWNFHKYLIDAKGARVVSFGSSVHPNDRALQQELQAMLNARRLAARGT